MTSIFLIAVQLHVSHQFHGTVLAAVLSGVRAERLRVVCSRPGHAASAAVIGRSIWSRRLARQCAAETAAVLGAAALHEGRYLTISRRLAVSTGADTGISAADKRRLRRCTTDERTDQSSVSNY